MAISDKYLVFGGSLGSVLIFLPCNRKYEYSVIRGESDDGYVCSLDISLDNKFIAVGFESGTLAIIDVLKAQYVKICKQIHTQCRILLVKFLHQAKKKFSVLSSDENGFTRIIHLENGFFGYDYSIQLGLPK